MKNFCLRMALVVLSISMSTISCSSGTTALLKAGSPLLSALTGNKTLSTISSLLQIPGLSSVLGTALKGKFTMLAPSNDALVSGLGSAAIGQLLSGGKVNISSVANLLKGLIVPGKLDASSLLKTGLKTVAGNSLNLGGINLGDIIGGENFNIFPIDKLIK